MDKLGSFFTLHFVVAFMRCFGDRLAVLRWTRIVFAEHFRYHHPHPYEWKNDVIGTNGCTSCKTCLGKESFPWQRLPKCCKSSVSSSSSSVQGSISAIWNNAAGRKNFRCLRGSCTYRSSLLFFGLPWVCFSLFLCERFASSAIYVIIICKLDRFIPKFAFWRFSYIHIIAFNNSIRNVILVFPFPLLMQGNGKWKRNQVKILNGPATVIGVLPLTMPLVRMRWEGEGEAIHHKSGDLPK